MELSYLARMPSGVQPITGPMADMAGFNTLLDSPMLQLQVSSVTPRQISEDGLILGRIHSKHTMAPVTSLSPQEWAAIVGTRGQALIDRFWGDYVAFVAVRAGERASHFEIIRAPFGRLGCFWHLRDGVILASSHPALLASPGTHQLHIDRMALARHIAQPELANDQTCLDGVRALTGGHRLLPSSPDMATDQLWSPWRFCIDRPEIESIEQAGEILRRTLLASVSAASKGFGKTVLMLSGGLDSSILAVCLTQAGRSFEAINLVTEAALGDERHFARLATEATGARLTEAYRSLDGVNLAQSQAALGARPFARAFSQESQRLTGALAERIGADAVVDGGNGDNLFFNYMSLAAMVEILRKSGLSRRLWHSCAAFADLTGTSMAGVFYRTVKRMLTRDNRLRIEPRDHFLTPALRHELGPLLPHPWLDPPASIGAGKAALLAGLATTQATIEQGAPLDGKLPRLSILVSQPVVETVLSLPIWCWFAPGHTRAAARAAFSKDLPVELIDRRTKGTPRPFMHDLYVHNRRQIRSILLDGRLASFGILDLEAVRAVIDESGPTRDFRYAMIMDLVDAEVWARSWD